MKSKLLLVAISAILVFATTTAVFANIQPTSKEDYTISDMDSFKDAISDVTDDDKVTVSEREELLAEADPEIVTEFVEEKIEEGQNALQAIGDPVFEEQADGSSRAFETVDIGDGCYATIELTDAEEPTLAGFIGDVFFEPVYATGNGTLYWKGYGNRYFTAVLTTFVVIGYATLHLENHYILSAKGIDENYGVAWPTGIAAFSNATEGTVIITDRVAHTVGHSNVNMNCRFSFRFSISGISDTTSRNFCTAIKFVNINKTTKKVQVKHTWSIN